MKRKQLRSIALVAALLVPIGTMTQGADSLYLATDVPTDLGTTTYLPWEFLHHDDGSYAAELQLPAGTAVDALYRRTAGCWRA